MIKIIAEAGINFAYGNDKKKFISNAEKLIKMASMAGCNFVKFQKRSPDLCVPEKQKAKEKIVPWSEKPITYIEYKRDIEFSINEYAVLRDICKDNGIGMFASVWDVNSSVMMKEMCGIGKIPSAKLTDWKLLEISKNMFNYRILSTGMSTQKEIDKAVSIFEPHVIMHTNSVYPTPVEDLNLQYLTYLKDCFPDTEIGYSSHYYGTKDVYPAIALGATWIEKHITLDHYFWGSDQSASVEPSGLFEMVKGIRDMEKGLRNGYESRSIYPGEEIKRESLRG